MIDVDLIVIGGVGFTNSEKLSLGSNGYEIRKIETPYGTTLAHIFETSGLRIAIIPRHFGTNHVPPHNINYRANIWATKSFACNRVLALNSVGTMNEIKNLPGTFFIPNDFIDYTKSRIYTFFDEKTVHLDMTDPYCAQMRSKLNSFLGNLGTKFSEGTYVCTEGPRFETKAEIKMLKQFGDVVGMTGIPEVILAREIGLCYCSICTITNYACGISTNKLTIDEVIENIEQSKDTLAEIILHMAKQSDTRKICACQNSIDGATL